MKPKPKKAPKPEASELRFCGVCCQKRYTVGGTCLVCGSKIR